MSSLVIVGAGGHGKVVVDIIRAAGRYEPVGFLDADPALAGTRVGGLPVFGAFNLLPKLRQQHRVSRAIVAIGDNRARYRYAGLLKAEGLELVNAIHPTAFVSPTAVLGTNVVVAPHATVVTEAHVGDSAIINTTAVVDHECDVGTAAHVCPAVALAGRVRVGEFAFVGIGAKVIQCRAVGAHAVIGAGAVVIEDVPDHATAVGVPARVVKVADPGSAAPPRCA
jgi:sugar O-acyltransferase (sialic acid O-acetyltransferase NeuD family)